MSFKMYHVLLSRAPASERYFSFFLDEIAMQNFFHNIQVPCYCCVVWYQTQTTFFASLFSLEVKLLWRNAFAHGKSLGRYFAVLVFLHSSILEFGRGCKIKQLLQGPGIKRPLHTPELDKVYRS